MSGPNLMLSMMQADESDVVGLLRQFRAQRERELAAASTFLNSEETAWFKNYVRSRQLLDYSPAQKRWLDEAYGHQVAWVIRFIRHARHPVRILDAGCGLGTESILFASLSAKVVGIDLWDENLSVARQRAMYWERTFGVELDLEFRRANLFRYRPPQPVHMIYGREAISHIHPIDGFFARCHEQLRSSGALVICDSNGQHPYIQFSAWRTRGASKYAKVSEPETGEDIPYAIERVVSPAEICRHLEEAGFRVIDSTTFGFVPVGLVCDRTYSWLRRLSRRLEQSPITASLGTRYVVVGRKRIADE